MDMEITFNEDLSGILIKLLIDQEAQLYAADTVPVFYGRIVDAILANLPEGFGSSIYQEGDFLEF